MSTSPPKVFSTPIRSREDSSVSRIIMDDDYCPKQIMNTTDPTTNDEAILVTTTTTDGTSAIQGHNEDDDVNPFQKKKRARTSQIWNEFKETKLSDGFKKAQCIHCKSYLSIIASRSTTHFGRHLKEKH